VNPPEQSNESSSVQKTHARSLEAKVRQLDEKMEEMRRLSEEIKLHLQRISELNKENGSR
jgi:hypothetical protein